MSIKSERANAGKKQGSKWKKGVSGNPTGKKPGTRHKATQLAEILLDGQTEQLVNKCVEMAIDGDSTAMRICMDRLIPPRKSRPITIQLPDTKTAVGVADAQSKVVKTVAEGELAIEDGQALSSILEARRKALETQDHEERLNKLEELEK